ncbi:S41 family peptidase [Rhodocytophaga aerolata]|uniref:S41 family peptidase n=1 Tax=Rhodocytophaga aerolata TaxID=455078 RepID=A0ABT8R5U1_9BACT|nr:S41 family peptidase [Rhodocytophaga aerolata]MDO1447470.1 S41 family peptidase [Rhodocytophaga aerolata]
MKLYYFLIWLVLSSLLSCKKEDSPTVTSPQAQAYIEEVVAIMQRYSVNRKQIDWNDFKQKITGLANGAQTIADTYPAITLALKMLEDNHSSYVAATGGRVLSGNTKAICVDFAPVKVPETDGIGYIHLPSSGGYDANGVKYGLIGLEYAQHIQALIKQQDQPALKGWIIDLRGNKGGDMWAMLAGVGPLLGEGTVGYFMDPDGNYYPWSYTNGVASERSPIYTVANPYILQNPAPKIALLTDGAVASAAEGITIAFKARANTRSFGPATCGVSTSNAPFYLSDGALLSLTVGIMADRTKKVYGGPVPSDENLSSLTAVQKAIEWVSQ